MRKLAVTILAMTGVGLLSVGTVSARHSVTVLNGAGSTFVSPLVSVWTPAFGSAFDYTVQYSAIGSGGGIQAITNRTVDFGASDPPLKPSDLAGHEIIQFTAGGSLSDWYFTENGREIRVPISSRFATNSTDAAIQHAEQGGGLISVLAYQAAEGLKTRKLMIVLSDYERPPLPIHLVYPTSRLLSAKVRAFVDLVVETADWRFGTK